MIRRAAAVAAVAAAVRAQQVGTNTAETHPKMSWSKCTSGGSCTSQSGEVVIDSNWRWVHDINGYTNCYTGNEWDTDLCPDDATCAANCALEGADYSGTYGASTSGNALTLKFVTNGGSSPNIGSRLYLMESSTEYAMFNLLGQEFTFDVDVSNLPCGLNGALYFVNMPQDGGLSEYSTNKAGAKYGTGYCDSQCPRDLKFINGEVWRIELPVACNTCILLTIQSRPMLRAGSHRTLIRTPVSASTARAARRWISGRPTRSPLPTLPILARTSPCRGARVTTAVAPTRLTAMAVNAILMAATSTP
jgi:hypothetical protein